jgi:hypothetical protein
MHVEDFFDDVVESADLTDPWSTGPTVRRVFKTDLVESIRQRQVAGINDLSAAAALADLVRDEMTRYGTDGTNDLSDQQIRPCLLALRALTKRIGLGEFSLTFRDFSSGFRTYWAQHGASGSGGWSARRLMVASWFNLSPEPA